MRRFGFDSSVRRTPASTRSSSSFRWTLGRGRFVRPATRPLMKRFCTTPDRPSLLAPPGVAHARRAEPHEARPERQRLRRCSTTSVPLEVRPLLWGNLENRLRSASSRGRIQNATARAIFVDRISDAARALRRRSLRRPRGALHGGRGDAGSVRTSAQAIEGSEGSLRGDTEAENLRGSAE
jgi:hypothetical protein